MQMSPPLQKPGFWGACYMENRHPLRGHRRLGLEHPHSTFEADGDDGRPGRAATHISAQEEDDHQMTHPGTSSTRRRNGIGSEVVRRSSDECLNCFFYMLYFILYKTKDTWYSVCYGSVHVVRRNFILVVIVFICSRIRPFLLLKCFYGIPHVFGISL